MIVNVCARIADRSNQRWVQWPDAGGTADKLAPTKAPTAPCEAAPRTFTAKLSPLIATNALREPCSRDQWILVLGNETRPLARISASR